MHFLCRTWCCIEKTHKSYTIKKFEWFHNKHLKSNTGKCNLITCSTFPVEIQIENRITSSVTRFKPFYWAHIDRRLYFDSHVSHICKKKKKKIHTISKVCKYMNQNKRRMLKKALVISQFSCCLLMEMFHSRNTENRVNKIHERALKLGYDGSSYLSYDELY